MRGSARRILIMMQHITMHGRANGRCLENNHDAGHRGACSCPGERGGAVGFGVLVLTEAQRTRQWTARPGRVQELYVTYVSELQLDLYTYAFYALTQAGHAAAGLASNPRSGSDRQVLAALEEEEFLQSICLGKGMFYLDFPCIQFASLL